VEASHRRRSGGKSQAEEWRQVTGGGVEASHRRRSGGKSQAEEWRQVTGVESGVPCGGVCSAVHLSSPLPLFSTNAKDLGDPYDLPHAHLKRKTRISRERGSRRASQEKEAHSRIKRV